MEAVKLSLKVVPGSSRDAIVGWMGDALKVKVRAPAERGKANAAVEKLIAAALQLPTEQVRIVSGHTNPRKVAEVTGLSAEEIRGRLDGGT